MHTPFDAELTRQHIWGGGLFLGGQPCPHPRWRGPSVPQFWGLLSIYAYSTPFIAELPNFTWLHMGGLFL